MTDIGKDESISCMYGIHNNDNMKNTWDLDDLMNTTSNGKYFGFCSYNVDFMVNCFLIGFKNEWTCYDSMTLELIKERNLVLGLIQENLMENSVQNCLPYILKPHGLCYYYFSLS